MIFFLDFLNNLNMILKLKSIFIFTELIFIYKLFNTMQQMRTMGHKAMTMAYYAIM